MTIRYWLSSLWQRPIVRYALCVVAGYAIFLILGWIIILSSPSDSLAPMFFLHGPTSIICSFLCTVIVFLASLIRINRYAYCHLWTAFLLGFISASVSFPFTPMFFSDTDYWVAWTILISVIAAGFAVLQGVWVAIVRMFDD